MPPEPAPPEPAVGAVPDVCVPPPVPPDAVKPNAEDELPAPPFADVVPAAPPEPTTIVYVVPQVTARVDLTNPPPPPPAPL